MGNRACSSLCYSSSTDHNSAVEVDDDAVVTTLATTASYSSAKLAWVQQDARRLDDDDDVPTDNNSESSDLYYKMLTQHESTNRFTATTRYEMTDGDTADGPTTASPTGMMPPQSSFGDHRSLSSDTNGRETRSEVCIMERRASTAGEREEIQDEISCNRSD